MQSLSDLSGSLFGEKVSIDTIRNWSKEDAWGDAILTEGFGVSEELERTKLILDNAYEDLVAYYAYNEKAPTEGSYVELDTVAAAAGEFKQMVAKLPRSALPLIESEIVTVRDILFEFVTEKYRRSSRTRRSRLTGVWTLLEKYILPDIPIETDAVIPADSLILGQRSSEPGSQDDD